MKRRLALAVVAALAGYGRHCYIEGLLAGRRAAFEEIARLDRRVARGRQ